MTSEFFRLVLNWSQLVSLGLSKGIFNESLSEIQRNRATDIGLAKKRWSLDQEVSRLVRSGDPQQFDQSNHLTRTAQIGLTNLVVIGSD